MQEKFKKIYEQVRMPGECSQRIEQAMKNKAENAQRIQAGHRQMPRPALAQAIALVVIVLFLLADGTVYAYTGEGIISRIASFAGNAVITRGTDEEGSNYSTVVYDAENAVAPAEYKEGHLWFTANGECIDITNQVSEDKAYTYEYKDGQGVIHYLIVGGDPETFGYAEFMYDETQPVGWIGGVFSVRKGGRDD